MMKSQFEIVLICAANLVSVYAFYNVFCKLLEYDSGQDAARKGKVRLITCYLVFYLSSTFLSLAHVHGLLRLAVFFSSLFLCVLFAHQGRMENKILVCLSSGGYGVLTEMLSGYLAALAFRAAPEEMRNRELHEMFVIIISRTILLCSSVGVSAAVVRLNCTIKAVKYWRMFLIFPLCSAMMIFCIVLDNVSGILFVEHLHNYMLTFTVLFMFFSGLGLLYLLGRIYQQSFDREKLQHLEQQKRLYMETMEIQKQAQEEMEKYRHDVKNLYLGLDNCIATKRYEEARDMLQKELAIVYQSRRVMNTGNLDLDCLLNHKISLAVSKGIVLEPRVKIKDPIQMEMRDLYILVGNMLDNAIEAVQTIPKKGEIKFCLDSSRGILYIRESNAFEGKLVKRGDGFATTKEESDQHGYGIDNMREVVERYGGKLNLHAEEQEFMAEVWIYFESVINEQTDGVLAHQSD